MKSLNILAALLFPVFIFAQSNTDGVSFFLSAENDVWANPSTLREDRNYTMGLTLGLTSPGFFDSYLTKPLDKILYKFYGVKLYHTDSLLELAPSVGLLGAAFTPEDLTVSEVIDYDRPYSFNLQLETNRRIINKNLDRLTTYTFSIGTLGNDLGKYIQDKIHDRINEREGEIVSPISQGWGNKISNNALWGIGEPTFLFKVQKDFLLTNKRIKNEYKRSYFEIAYGYNYSIGYFTGAEVYSNVRLGFLDTRNWTTNNNPLAAGSKGGAPPSLDGGIGIQDDFSFYKEKSRKPEFYFYASIRPIAMLYNSNLFGQFAHSAHRLDYFDARHFLLEYRYGIGISFGCINIQWLIQAFRTSDVTSSLVENHYWGGGNIWLNF